MSRTLFDLATVVNRHRLETAFNEVEVRGLTDRLSVVDLLERYPRRRGSAALRAIMADEKKARGITKKELERRFAAVLAGTDLPRPRRNADLAVGGRFFEVDCLWADQRLIVELDGRATHGTARAFERDREKDRLLLGRRLARHPDHLAPAARRCAGGRCRSAQAAARIVAASYPVANEPGAV